jgi:hypothetical protein
MLALQNQNGGTSMAIKANTDTFRYWHRHVEAFKASGLTREAYSKRNRIRVYQLDYWRKRILRMGGTPETISANQWVPLKISDEPTDKGCHIDLWIGPVRIEVKPGFDSKLLTELLRAVGAGC